MVNEKKVDQLKHWEICSRTFFFFFYSLGVFAIASLSLLSIVQEVTGNNDDLVN